MDKRLGIIGITVQDRFETAPKVNQTLSKYGEIIVARMGLPFRDKDVNVIGIFVEATTDQVGALTGQLGMLEGVKVKSLLV